MANKYYLSEQDRERLDLLFKRVFGSATQLVPDDQEEPIPRTPDTYVALVPEEGIPALEGDPDGTGSGEGTAPDFAEGDRPGSLECDIYRIVDDPDAPSGGRLEVTQTKRLVWNLTGSMITKGWITVTKDKYGSWIAQVGSSAPWEVFFEICKVCCQECFVEAVILRQNQQGVPPGVGEVITICPGEDLYYDYDPYYPGIQKKLEAYKIQVWDKMGVMIEDMVGWRGWASWVYPPSSDVQNCIGGTETEDVCAGEARPAGRFQQGMWLLKSLNGPNLCVE